MTKFVIYIRFKLYGIVLNYMELYDFFEIVWNSVVSNKMNLFPHKTDIFLERNASFFAKSILFSQKKFKTVYLYAKFNNSKYMFFFKLFRLKRSQIRKLYFLFYTFFFYSVYYVLMRLLPFIFFHGT